MARIIISSYVVRLPVGGYQSWMLRWLVGLARLGHDVWFVEKSGWKRSCIDPFTWKGSDDCRYGISAWHALLGRFGLQDRWCFVDASGRYHGVSRTDIEAVFRSADLFVDHLRGCEWIDEASWAGTRVMVDGEPGYTQMQMAIGAAEWVGRAEYDHYCTVGLNVGDPSCTVPAAGKRWRPIVDPVVMDLLPDVPPPPGAAYSTIMSWRVHKPLAYLGASYGSKDLEFPKIMDLPSRTPASLEMAFSGKAPVDALRGAGWILRDSVQETVTYDAWLDYIVRSRGEVSVSKQCFVATNSGHFSERTAAYLGCGRPAVVQDTGFSRHLPCGRGLLAFRTVDEAAAAIDTVERDYDHHCRWARELAREHLASDRVLPRWLADLGL